jgi:hypothetical protein
MNGVAERRNHTLMKIVRSMLVTLFCHYLSGEKHLNPQLTFSIAYQLRRLTKLLMSCELGANLVCNISKYGGSPAEARFYKPNKKKLDEKTVSCYFFGYAERSRGISYMIPLIELFSR